MTNFKDGLKCGDQKKYYDSGYLKETNYYENDLLEGDSCFYDDKTEILMRHYIYSKGKKEGRQIEYNREGRESINYIAKDGDVEGYYELKGAKGPITFYTMINKKKEGEACDFHTDGTVAKRQWYKNGLLHGKCEQFKSDG